MLSEALRWSAATAAESSSVIEYPASTASGNECCSSVASGRNQMHDTNEPSILVTAIAGPPDLSCTTSPGENVVSLVLLTCASHLASEAVE